MSTPLRVAIVGAGPAGLYAAAELGRQAAELQGPGVAVEVNLFDRLPTPGGLARSGVAPDHYSRRVVTDHYEAQARRSTRLEFFGNVEIGAHLTLDALSDHHHAVIHASGAGTGRLPGIPGEDLPGCHTATDFVGWYNGHPDHAEQHFDLSGECAVIVGVGNVALDVARILLSTPEQRAESDMPAYAQQALADSRIREVLLLGRGEAAQAAFACTELREFAALPDVRIRVTPAIESAACDSPKAILLAQLEANSPQAASRSLHFRFGTQPRQITRVGDENPLTVDCDGPQNEHDTLEAGLVIFATGYWPTALPGLPMAADGAHVNHREGRIVSDAATPLPGQYVTGWLKRGPRGVLGSNKRCAAETVRALLADFADGRLPDPQRGQASLESLIEARAPARMLSADWRRIDATEQTDPTRQAPRKKLTTMADIQAVLGGAD